jgi:hypothetical protein
MTHICYTRDQVPIPAQSLCHPILVILDLAKLRISRFAFIFVTLASAVSTPRGFGYLRCFWKGYLETIDDLCSPQNLLRRVARTPWQEATFGIHADRITVDEVNEHL